MKFDAILPMPALAEVGPITQRLEDLGFDGFFTSEVRQDPFLPLALAIRDTKLIELGTAIAVALPRSPMHLAQISRDLQAYSRGRFILGLGSQVKAHIERRFSAQFDHPVARMREMILAIRAIWKSWEEDSPLQFEGEFYRHTLMTPFFNPGPSGFGTPRIYLAAVGERMTEAAGEVADGMLIHGFTTELSLRQRALPALQRGLARAGRSRSDVELTYPVFVVTGESDEEFERAATAVRNQIAFYASTPTYRGVLEVHGWEGLQEKLHGLTREGRWSEMGACISDEMLHAFAVCGRIAEIPAMVAARYSDLVDRLSFASPLRPDPEQWAGLIAACRAIPSLARHADRGHAQAEPTQWSKHDGPT
jgi:probable F420-dependent oxidoreductase